MALIMMNVKIIVFVLSVHHCIGDLPSPENDSLDTTGPGIPSVTTGQVSGSLRNILNQESLVRFAMVQRIQKLVLDMAEVKSDFKDMQRALVDVKNKLQTLATKDQNLEIENAELKQTLQTIYTKHPKDKLASTDFESLKNETLILKVKYNELLLENNTFQKQLNIMNGQMKKVDDLSKRLNIVEESMQNMFLSVNSSIENIRENLNISCTPSVIESVKPTTLETPGNYAFYAQLTSSVTQDNVVFENVTTNEGSSYNDRTGIFTCKYSGPYVFSWTVGTSGGRQANADLIVNSNVKGTVHSDSFERANSDSATGFIVTNLQVGDQVRVRVSNGTIDGQYSTFSGWRLNQNFSFHARATTALQRPASIRKGFVFEEVSANNGHSYLSSNGTFVCPESGLYALAVNVEAKNKEYYVYFYKDGSRVKNVGVWPDSSSGDYLDSSATIQLFQFSAGDAIYLYSPQRDVQLEPIRSTYSGWLIESGRNVKTPAFLEQMKSSSPSSYSTARFNTEHLDTTRSFSPTTGFTAPQNGVYMIFWNMEAHKRHLKTTLVVNDAEYGYTVSDGRSSGYDSGSNVAVLRLRSRDVVNIMLSTSADDGETMISGYKLF